MTGSRARTFRSWFWQPPRPHGATIHHREVSALELFYDLVYVAVVGQAAHQLATHVDGRAVVEFGIVFSLVWFAWLNGSLYLEIHGRNDGRTRSFVFGQMAILVVLAVFTGEAAGETARPFAVAYAGLFAVMGWLWYSVRGQDEASFSTLTAVYVAGMAISVAVVLGSALLPTDARLVVWAAFSAAWIVAFVVFGRMRSFAISVAPTHSMVERFGLFAIIVLGEVVFGVVGGLTEGEPDPLTIATGLLALGVGFGMWWAYFDIVGRRLPRADGPAIVRWLLIHLPLTMAIAGAGAGMTSLVAHAHDPASERATAWLLGGSAAVALGSLVVVALALEDARRWPSLYRKTALTMATGAIAAIVVAVVGGPPWLLALLLDAIFVVMWLEAIPRFVEVHALDATDPDPRPAAQEVLS